MHSSSQQGIRYTQYTERVQAHSTRSQSVTRPARAAGGAGAAAAALGTRAQRQPHQRRQRRQRQWRQPTSRRTRAAMPAVFARIRSICAHKTLWSSWTYEHYKCVHLSRSIPSGWDKSVILHDLLALSDSWDNYNTAFNMGVKYSVV